MRLNRIDVTKNGDMIEISMNYCANSIEKLYIRDGKPDETLTKEEMKFYRKYVELIEFGQIFLVIVMLKLLSKYPFNSFLLD